MSDKLDMHAAGREAGSQFNRGNGALRNFVARCKEVVEYKTGEPATADQLTKLREYQADAYIGAMSDHLAKGGKPTAAMLAEATAIVTVRKGFSKQAKDTDDRRTHAQHKVMGRVREAWSKAAKEYGLPALDNRGGSNKGGTPRTEAEATGGKAKVASFGFTKTTAPAVFAEGLAALCTRYIAEQGAQLVGDYGSIIRGLVSDVTALRAKQAA